MAQYPRLAKLLAKIRPGLYIISAGMVVYLGVSVFSPESVELRAAVFFFSNLIGLTVSGLGFISWFKPSPRMLIESLSVHPDTPQLRSLFASQMLAASRLAPECASEEFRAAVAAASQEPIEIEEGECWSSPIKLAGDTPYSARAYFGFWNGRLGFAMIYGMPGVWHQGYTLVGDYEQEGSVFTLRNTFGDLGAWGEDGTKFIFRRLARGAVHAELAATRFIDADPFNFPAMLKCLMAN